MAADEGLDDDGPEFRAPLPPEDRVWRHPAELGALANAAAAASAAEAPAGRSPWTVGFVSVIGGVLLASSLMFGVGGVGEEPGRIALRPIATIAPLDDDHSTRIAALDAPPSPASLVGVDVEAADDVRSGNGLVVHGDGLVVTTAWLVAGATDIRVTDTDGTMHTASVVGVDALDDIALLRVADLTLAPTSLDPAAAARVGQTVYAFNASRGVVSSHRSAAVSSLDGRLSSGSCDLHGVIELDDTLDVSAAGAPLLDTDGRILGLVTTRRGDDATVAIPTRTVEWVVTQLVESGEVRHGWLGVEGVNAVSGARVSRVVEASPALDAGLVADDVVVAVDGEPVTTMSSLVVAVRERAPGTTVTVSIQRADERLDVPVALADAPAPVAALN